MSVPGSTELQMIPFILSLNDADGATRETQQVWSIKPNVTNQWWNTPAMWETVAVAGLDVTTATEDVDVQGGFSLAPSAPNPADREARFSFTLATAEHATVEVFNLLGQRVLTVADGPFAPGKHDVSIDTSALPAGVYVYRLVAGVYTDTQRMLVLH